MLVLAAAIEVGLFGPFSGYHVSLVHSGLVKARRLYFAKETWPLRILVALLMKALLHARDRVLGEPS